MPFLHFCNRLYSNFRDNARYKFQKPHTSRGTEDGSMDIDETSHNTRGRRSTRNQQQALPESPSPSSTSQAPPPEDEIPRSDNSFKVVSNSGLLLLLINQIYQNEEEIMGFFKRLIPTIIDGLEYMPTREEQLRNKQTFLDYLEALKFIISHITFMLRSRSMPEKI